MQQKSLKYYDKTYAQVLVLEREKTIAITWKGSISAKEYNDTWKAVYLAATEKGFRTIISDTRHGGIVPEESKHWLLHTFAHRLAQAVRYICVVVSENRNRISFSDSVRKNTEGLFVFHYFDTLEEAKEWSFTC